MAADLRLPFRKALVTYLRADGELTALVPAASLYGERVPAKPTWPFTALGRMPLEDWVIQGVDGGSIEFQVHVFGEGESSDVLFPITKRVIELLKDAQLTLDDGWCLDISFVRAVPLNDNAENTRWHDVLTFVALTGVEN